jgi:hypothetical protein
MEATIMCRVKHKGEGITKIKVHMRGEVAEG